MYSMGGYPLGAQYDPEAPYNQKEPELIEVEVCVSCTVHKNVKVKVPQNYDEVVLRLAADEATWRDRVALLKNGWAEDEFETIEE